MRILGFEIGRAKAAVGITDLAPTDWRTSYIPYLQEAATGNWQRGVKIRRENVMGFSTLFACQTLIASDVSKLCLKLEEKDADGIWQETTSPAFSAILSAPNSFQNRVQFFESWMLAKLIHGNAYILKQRDGRGVVRALYVLDPQHVRVLVGPTEGAPSIFYKLSPDNLSGISEEVTVPASEIIHDRINTFWHPLVGVSPISACGLAATQGLEIQTMSTQFFKNGAQPGGILSAPDKIDKETAERLKKEWHEGFGGTNSGKVAVLGNGLKFQSMSMNPVDAQLIEQLKYSSQMICTAHHVPPFKIGIDEPRRLQKPADYNRVYFADALQRHVVGIEVCMRDGLALPAKYRVRFDIDDLIRMDPEAQMTMVKDGVGGKVLTPNEGRKKVGFGPTGGGDTLWGQDQDHSLEWLQWRDGQPGSASNPPRLAGKDLEAAFERALEQLEQHEVRRALPAPAKEGGNAQAVLPDDSLVEALFAAEMKRYKRQIAA